MTPAQLKCLQSAARTGNPTAHLFGRSEWGGWTWTRASLIRKGWLDGRNDTITDAGRAALATLTAGHQKSDQDERPMSDKYRSGQ